MTPSSQPSPAEQIRISIVVPMHNEEGNVRPLWDAVRAVIPKLGGSVELVVVNDGSTDGTSRALEELAVRDPGVRVVELDGNFGQASAFCAGFEAARGEVILTMDGDLQNDPDDFLRALAKIEEGFRAVTGWRKNRSERFWDRVLPSLCANWLIGKVTGVPIHDHGCGLKAYRADVVKGKYLPRGFNRFMPSIFGVKAHEVTEIVVTDRKRLAGKSHSGLNRIFIVLKDLLAVPWILRGPEKYLVRFRWLRMVAATGGIAFLLSAVLSGRTGAWLGAILLLAFAATFHLIVANLDRFTGTQRTKGFRVRRVIGGTSQG